jgi:hypothetical protein
VCYTSHSSNLYATYALILAGPNPKPLRRPHNDSCLSEEQPGISRSRVNCKNSCMHPDVLLRGSSCRTNSSAVLQGCICINSICELVPLSEAFANHLLAGSQPHHDQDRGRRERVVLRLAEDCPIFCNFSEFPSFRVKGFLRSYEDAIQRLLWLCSQHTTMRECVRLWDGFVTFV